MVKKLELNISLGFTSNRLATLLAGNVVTILDFSAAYFHCRRGPVHLANPEYHLSVFCTEPSGIPGLLFKAQSPALHIAIGYGFLTLRSWALSSWPMRLWHSQCHRQLLMLGFGRVSHRVLHFPPGLYGICHWRRACLGYTTDDPKNGSWITKVRPSSSARLSALLQLTPPRLVWWIGLHFVSTKPGED